MGSGCIKDSAAFKFSLRDEGMVDLIRRNERYPYHAMSVFSLALSD